MINLDQILAFLCGYKTIRHINNKVAREKDILLRAKKFRCDYKHITTHNVIESSFLRY